MSGNKSDNKFEQLSIIDVLKMSTREKGPQPKWVH